MEIKIRDIRPEDILQTTRLYHDTWIDTYPNEKLGITREAVDKSFEGVYTEDTQKKRTDRVRNLPANEKYIVAESGDKIVGTCRIVRHNDYGQLKTIYVLPDFQGRGVGKALWEAGKKKQNTIVHVATYNSKAISFYKKIGFIETGKIFNEERHRMSNGILIPETELVRPGELTLSYSKRRQA